DTDATTTFSTNGSHTVAVRLTDANNNVQILTHTVTVTDPPPTLTVPTEMEVNVGGSQPLAITATTHSGIASVEWTVSFDGSDYVSDPNLTGLSPSYRFSTFGTYAFWVVATANDGQTTENGFFATAGEVTPTAAISPVAPILEGNAATFTVNTIDP